MQFPLNEFSITSKYFLDDGPLESVNDHYGLRVYDGEESFSCR